MKTKVKIAGIACAVALASTIGMSSAFAVGYGNGGYCVQDQTASTDKTTVSGTVHGVGFIDENGDGACDNIGTNACGGTGCEYVDADGDGVCDHAGSGAGMGAGTGMGVRGFHGGR